MYKMNINTFDILLLFVLAIVVSMIIGYNIVYIIDKKISNVNINIPPVYVPKPNVIVKINKDNFDVNVETNFQQLNGKAESDYQIINKPRNLSRESIESFGNLGSNTDSFSSDSDSGSGYGSTDSDSESNSHFIEFHDNFAQPDFKKN